MPLLINELPLSLPKPDFGPPSASRTGTVSNSRSLSYFIFFWGTLQIVGSRTETASPSVSALSFSAENVFKGGGL